jgi:hypothetical protein
MNYISPRCCNTGRAGTTYSAVEIAPMEVTGRGGDLGGAGMSCCFPQADRSIKSAAASSRCMHPAECFENNPHSWFMSVLSV